MNFRNWIIIKYFGKDNRFGDLANDIKASEDFPDTSNRSLKEEKETITTYLYRKNACGACMDTFFDAFKRYARWVKQRDL